MNLPDLNRLSPIDLLQLSGRIIDELRDRGITRTGNNPLADYTEWMISQAYGFSLSPRSTKGYDAIDLDGKKVEIKARRITKRTPSRQLSSIRKFDEELFDYLICVIYDQDFDIDCALRIPREVIEEKAIFKQHTNSYALIANSTISNDPRVLNITKELKEKLAEPGSPYNSSQSLRD